MEQTGNEWQYGPSRRLMDCASPDFDLRKARSLAEKGEAEGNPDARYIHGLFLYLGEGGTIRDVATATESFTIAASEGHLSSLSLIHI